MKITKKFEPAPKHRFFPKIWRAGKVKSQVLYWQGEVSGHQYRAHSGVEGGKDKVGAWSDAYAQNVGKSNERSAEEQAVAIVQSKQEKRLKNGGYFYDKAKIGTAQFVAPMLAHKYEKGMKINFPALFQPKLNGFRNEELKQGAFSRNGEKFVACPHITKALAWAFEKMGATLNLDGEYYNHDLREDLQEISSLVRKQKPTPEELKASEEKVQYHIYDSVHLGGESEAQEARLKRAATVVTLSRSPYVKLVPTYVVKNEKELEERYKEALVMGYEGGMLRFPSAPYERDRSVYLLKYKPRSSAEFKILRFEEGNGKRKGMAAKVWCVTASGVEFKANVKWTDKRKKQIWADRTKYAGTQATVSYAYITVYGRPFHSYLEMLWDNKEKI